MKNNVGQVAQVLGAVVDVQFPEGHVPSLYNAITVVDNASRPEARALLGELADGVLMNGFTS